MALEWADVDLGRSLLRVHRSYDPKAREYVAPKSRAGARTVPIPTVLRDHLDAWRVACPWDEGLAFGETAGRPFHDGKLAGRVRRAGADPRVTLHVGRYSFVTWLAEAGLGADVVQRTAGHSSITVTMDRYRHVLEKTTTRPAEVLQEWLDAERRAADELA